MFRVLQKLLHLHPERLITLLDTHQIGFKKPRQFYFSIKLYLMKKYLFFFMLFILFLYLIFHYKTQNNFSYSYSEDFLTNNDLIQLNNELKNYDQKLENSLEDFPNVLRFNTPINSIKIRNILESYTNKIRDLTSNNKIYLAKNFPIEYRKYIKGSFMKKHKDQLIYKIPQYECILTLSNSTDSHTIFDAHPDPQGKASNKKIKSKPNSLIIVKAQGIEHEVTQVTQGERYFIKFIFTETDQFAVFI